MIDNERVTGTNIKRLEPTKKVMGVSSSGVPKLTEQCNYVIRSIMSILSLKSLCMLSIVQHKLVTNDINTQNYGYHDDHTYDSCVTLGQSNIANNQDHHESIMHVENLDSMLSNNTHQSSNDDTNIVIDSMIADIPLCTENTNMINYRWNPDNLPDVLLPLMNDNTPMSTENTADSISRWNQDTTDGMVTPKTTPPNINPVIPIDMEGLSPENSFLDTSLDGSDKLSYDPTGTQLILPLKKHKPVVANPEQTVLEIWRKDALSHNWTVPVLKLSNSDIYDLSHKPPNWSDMDPYSGLEEENEDVSNTADQSDNIKLNESNATSHE